MTWNAIACAGILVVSCSYGGVSQSRRPLTLEDLFAMRRVASPALSPDGNWIAYNVSMADTSRNANSTQLWISSTHGGIPRPLATQSSINGNAAWSPDGRWLVFESNRSGILQLWLMNMGGGDAKEFTSLSTGATDAVWSPDGKSIAFISEVFPEYSELPFAESDRLNQIRLDAIEHGKVRARLLTHLLYRHWNQWVEGKRKHIFVQLIDGGSPRDITPGDRDAAPASATFSAGIDYCFSPDGTEIAYTASPNPGREESWRTNYDVYTVRVAGGSARQLTTNPAADGFPRYSPDGTVIAYRAQRRPGFEADRWELMLFDRAAGSTRSLTPNFDASIGAFVWSPDGTALYFLAQEQGRVPIFRVSAKGNDVHRIFDQHSSHDLHITQDGKHLFFAQSSAVRPDEIFRCRTDGSGLEPVTGLNDSLFSNLELPPPESVWFEGAGGTRIQAWVFTPPHLDRSLRYPLILMVHGGPQGAWIDGWSYRWNPPLWAAQGYVIVAPNPRGSTGFGQKFTDEISGDWGGKPFVDLMKALDYAQSLPFVDSARTAAAGASYGGYMMNWFLGNAGDRFKAIVTHDGVYNFSSAYGTTDELWFDEWEHGGPPWQDLEKYSKFSPNRYAMNFRTPTLVIHGALDYRVSEGEGMQLFTALQRQGVPSEFLYFPDEGHWVLKPANSQLWHRTVFAWLARFLKN